MRERSDDQRKKRLQRRIVSDFLLEYNWDGGTKFEIQRDGEPPEPDVICHDTRTGERIGIEVTVEHYEDAHARSVWQQARGKKAPEYRLTQTDAQENIRVLRRVNEAIGRKSNKSYQFPGRLILLVTTEPFRLYLTGMKRALAILCVPVRHPFHEIYIYSTHGEPYQLFPAREWIGTYRSGCNPLPRLSC